MAPVPASVKLCSATPREGVRSTGHIMDDQMPAERAETQVAVFIPGMPKHAAGVHFALARPGPVDHRFFKLVVAVATKNVALMVDCHAARHIREKLRRQAHGRNSKPFSLAPDVRPLWLPPPGRPRASGR